MLLRCLWCVSTADYAGIAIVVLNDLKIVIAFVSKDSKDVLFLGFTAKLEKELTTRCE